MAPHRKRQRVSEEGAAAPAAGSDGDDHEVEDYGAEAAKRKQPKPSRSLFVRSLPANTTNDDLTEHFSQSYPIKHAMAVTDSSTKQCKGYGFVTFADAEDAQRAMEEFNGSTLLGKKIRVEVAEPRHRKGESGEAPAQSTKKSFREQQEAQPAPKLIVRNLPWTIKEPDQLAALFRSYGKIKHVSLPKKGEGLMAGFGIVLIRGRKNAEKAIAGINGKEVDGRTLAVDWAVDKETWQKVKKEAAAEDEAKDEAEDGAGKQKVDSAKTENGEDEHIAGSDLEKEADDSDVDSAEASNEDDEMDEEEGSEIEADDEEDENSEKQVPRRMTDNSSTLFIRNLPFTCTDEDLEEHFEQFGPIRYARVVLDRDTERPRGTGFVCFVKTSDADACVKDAPRQQLNAGAKPEKTSGIKPSVLQNVDADPTGNYTMEGRVLQVTRAVDKNEATRLTEQGVANRYARDKDKRRLYLLSEGTIASNSPLYKMLSPAEIAMREASTKQRKALIESNPSLHLSLTRLSIRNIPRTVTSKDLKALAREAVVGFAKDVKDGKRQPLSKEENARGGEEMKAAEKLRKLKGKGIVKQATIAFEGREGGKVKEGSGAGRSRGYGFLEFFTHRAALMALRWLNGHAIDYTAKDTKAKAKPASREELQERKKRLIAEFAIENAQVVARRKDKEEKARERSKAAPAGEKGSHSERAAGATGKTGSANDSASKNDRKRKRDVDQGRESKDVGEQNASRSEASKDEKLAKRQKIIQRKRMMRRSRKKGGA